MTYPTPPGWDSAERNRVEDFIRRAIKYEYCAHSTPTVASLCDQADQRLFVTVTQNNALPLQQLLPPNLEVKREYYQNCYVLGCVTHCSVSSTLIWAVLTGLADWVCHIGTLTPCIEAVAYNMVEWCWWDSSVICKTNWLPSVLWHCRFGHMTCKNRTRYDL